MMSKSEDAPSILSNEDTLTLVTPAAEDSTTSTLSSLTPLLLDDNPLSLTTITSDTPSLATSIRDLISSESTPLSSTTLTVTSDTETATTNSAMIGPEADSLTSFTDSVIPRSDYLTPETDSLTPVIGLLTPDTDTLTPCDSTLHAEDLVLPLSPTPLPLLNIPTLPDEENDVSSMVSVTSTLSEAVTLTESVPAMRDLSLGQLPGADLLTESQSTGEVPSLLTFSTGEIGMDCTIPPLDSTLPPVILQPIEGHLITKEHTREPQLLQISNPEDRQEMVNDSPSAVHPNRTNIVDLLTSPIEEEYHSLTVQDTKDDSISGSENKDPLSVSNEVKGNHKEELNNREHLEMETQQLNPGLAENDEEASVAKLDDSHRPSVGAVAVETHEQDNETIKVEEVEKTEVDGEIECQKRSLGPEGEEQGMKSDDKEQHETSKKETEQGESHDSEKNTFFSQEEEIKQITGVHGDMSNSIAGYFLEQRRKLGWIIRSELQRYLQDQHKQNADDSVSEKSSGNSIPVSSQPASLAINKTSTSDLCTAHLQDTKHLVTSPPPPPPPPLPTPPPPPLLLLPQPLSSPTPSLHPNIFCGKNTGITMPRLPLLKLDNTDTSSSPVDGPLLLPHPPVRMRLSAPLPLLSLDKEPQEPFLPPLLNIQHNIPPRRPLLSYPSLKDEPTFPLLQYPLPITHSSVNRQETPLISASLPPQPPSHISHQHRAWKIPVNSAPFTLLQPPSHTLPLTETEQLLPLDQVCPQPVPSTVEPREKTNTEPHTKQPGPPSVSLETNREITEKENREPWKDNLQHTKSSEISKETVPVSSHSIPFHTRQPSPSTPSSHSTHSATTKEVLTLKEPPTTSGSKLDIEEEAPTTDATNTQHLGPNEVIEAVAPTVEATNYQQFSPREVIEEVTPTTGATDCKQLSPSEVIPSSESEGCMVDQPSCQTPPDKPHYYHLPTVSYTTNNDDAIVYDRDIPVLSGDIKEKEQENEEGWNKEVEVLEGSDAITMRGEEEIDAEKDAHVNEIRVKATSPHDKARGDENENRATENKGRSEGDGGRKWPVEMAKGGILSQLQKLETQLSAIETRARTVEGELLISNQLLGTIEELQGVHRKPREPVTPPETSSGQSLTDQSDSVMREFSRGDKVYRTANDSTYTSNSSNGTDVSCPRNKGRINDSLTPLNLPPVTTTAISQPLKSSTTHYSTHAISTNTTSITSTSTNQVPSSSSISYQDTKQIKAQKSPVKELTRGQVDLASVPLTGQCSRQTIMKWVTTRKREISWELAEPQKTHKNPGQMFRGKSDSNLRRTPSQEHKEKRLTEALDLMEDILSAKPPSPSIPVSSTTSRSLSKSTTRPLYTHSLTVPLKRNNHRTAHTSKDTGESTKELGKMRYSITEGLTPREQLQMAHIMASTDLSSASSGSVASTIDWELVDQLIDN